MNVSQWFNNVYGPN